MSVPRPGLMAILTRRIAFFALLAMLVQLAVVFSDYYGNAGELARLYVEEETERLAEGVGPPGTAYALPASLDARYGAAPATGYVARVRDDAGKTLFQSCDTACEAHFLPAAVNPPDFWLRSLSPGLPLTLVGGRALEAGGRRVTVDVAVIGDPDDLVSGVLWNEVLDHMIVPMGILLVLVLGATLLSVRRAVRPVEAAAEAADRLDPMDSRSELPTAGMPREIAHLTEAVNRAFVRVGALMASQRLLTSGIAHEIRTPLAALKLELGRIDHPRARKAEADLDALVRFVGDMTALARLDGFDHAMFVPVDLVALGRDVVEDLAPFVYDHDHTLEFSATAAQAPLLAIPALLKDAARNLVENAVRHTRPGTRIIVEVGAGGIAVEDIASEGGAVAPAPTGDGLGIGLKIVGRIAELHGGTLGATVSATGRRFALDLPARVRPPAS
ncbi:sensor histidine kinase [Ensifer soli]|uniref:sensor histidine kinase n=1 Tax=Ciceribacter sp. sgz301302 TaxID=3342379 RepID=UPI0035BB6E38